MHNRNNKKNFFIKSILMSLIVVIPWVSFADLPVIDPMAIFQLKKQFDQLQRQYNLLKNQNDLLSHGNTIANNELNQTTQLVRDAEGHYGLGGLNNSLADLKNRQWSPDNWQDALKGLSGGNPERYQQLLTSYQKSNPTLSQEDYERGASNDKAQRYSEDIQVNQAVNVNTTYAFNDIKTHLQNVYDLSQQIDSTPNEKAATDLNSRLLVEMAYIQVQELKMQTLINQQMGQSEADDIADRTAAAKFNALPNS